MRQLRLVASGVFLLSFSVTVLLFVIGLVETLPAQNTTSWF